MKKIIAFLLTAMLLLALTACGDNNSGYVNYGTTGNNTATNPSDPSDPSDPSNPSTPSQGDSANDSNTTEKEETPVAVSDPFTNDTSYESAPMGEVSIQPKYVYWNGDMLVAVCFVVNATDYTVTNVDLELLEFAGPTGDLASATFGILEDLTLEPMTYDEWTFQFDADCIYEFGADLSSLDTHSSIAYDYY